VSNVNVQTKQQTPNAGLESLVNRLVDEVAEIGPTVEVYRWSWEEERWHDLVACLLGRIGEARVSRLTARRTAAILNEFGLLEIANLASTSKRYASLDDSEDFKATVMVLQRMGFDDASHAAAEAVYCVGAAIGERYDGKLQRYLREYGNMMVEQLHEKLSFGTLPLRDAQYAFTQWLQEDLNMPVPLSDPAIEKLCRHYDVDLEELLKEIDVRDINVAILDQLACQLLPELESS
jgi:hypothetical protein